MVDDPYRDDVSIDEKLYNAYEGNQLAGEGGDFQAALYYANKFVETLASARAEGALLSEETVEHLPHMQNEIHNVLRELYLDQRAQAALNDRPRDQGDRGLG